MDSGSSDIKDLIIPLGMEVLILTQSDLEILYGVEQLAALREIEV